MAKIDVYQIVTDRIVAELEKGNIPWKKPWVAAGCGSRAISHATGKPYSLLNQCLLGRPGEYLTSNQIKKEGGKLRDGEEENKSMIVFWSFREVDKKKGKKTSKSKKNDKVEDSQDEKENADSKPKKKIPILKYFIVYHIDQCEGIKPKCEMPPLPNAAEADENADNIMNDYVEREKITLRFVEGNEAYYQPSTDTIVLPTKAQFTATAEFYGTAFHEMTHSTGAEKRLNRINKKAAFGGDDYSKEELVAEIGSAVLLNHVGLETESSMRNNAAYVQSWLRALRNDKRLIVGASKKAEDAVNFILGNN